MRLFVSTLLVVLSWQLQVWAQGKPATIAVLAAYNRPDREQVLYEGAKKEGKLMWYTSLTGGPNTEAPQRFLRRSIQASRWKSTEETATR
jgi:hypothetical protein